MRPLLKYAGIEQDTLRFDSIVITRYGKQEGAKKGYNPTKRGRPSNHPQLAFLGYGSSFDDDLPYSSQSRDSAHQRGSAYP